MRFKLVLILLLFSLPLFAGDLPDFVSLGFSPSSQYYMFGYYGLNEEGYGYSEIYIVDVKNNSYASGGVFTSKSSSPLDPGEDPFGLFLNLFDKTKSAREKYNINPELSGRLIYLKINGNNEKIDFRDFLTGRRFIVEIKKSKYSAPVSASFYLDVKIQGTTTKQYTVGAPDYKRPGIVDYLITRIIVSKDDKAVIFIILKKEDPEKGGNLRFMVETLYIQ